MHRNPTSEDANNTEYRRVVEVVYGVLVPVTDPMPAEDARAEAKRRNELEADFPPRVRCTYATQLCASEHPTAGSIDGRCLRREAG